MGFKTSRRGGVGVVVVGGDHQSQSQKRRIGKMRDREERKSLREIELF